MSQPDQFDDGATEPAAPTTPSPWLRILLIALIVLFSLAATVLVTIQSRTADQTPTLPTHDVNTGIELSDVVASTHGVDVQFPVGFTLTTESWEMSRAALGVQNAELGQRHHLFIYQDAGDFEGAAADCLHEINVLEDSLASVIERIEPSPLEPGSDVAAQCLLSGTTDDGAGYSYAYRIFTPPGGPAVGLQTRTGLDMESELHEDLEIYFTCIAAEAAAVELEMC